MLQHFRDRLEVGVQLGLRPESTAEGFLGAALDSHCGHHISIDLDCPSCDASRMRRLRRLGVASAGEVKDYESEASVEMETGEVSSFDEEAAELDVPSNWGDVEPEWADPSHIHGHPSAEEATHEAAPPRPIFHRQPMFIEYLDTGYDGPPRMGVLENWGRFELVVGLGGGNALRWNGHAERALAEGLQVVRNNWHGLDLRWFEQLFDAFGRRRNMGAAWFERLFEDGWGLVRASNTQPALVLRCEARTEEGLALIRETIESKVAESMRIAQGHPS